MATDKKRISTPLIPELYCRDIGASIQFYCQTLGFDILYQREEEGFVMLDYHGARLMLDQIGKTRDWCSAQLEHPFGRGINLQILCPDIDSLYKKVLAADISPFLEIESKAYAVQGSEQHVRQFIIQDPDGYLLRFQQDL